MTKTQLGTSLVDRLPRLDSRVREGMAASDALFWSGQCPLPKARCHTHPRGRASKITATEASTPMVRRISRLGLRLGPGTGVGKSSASSWSMSLVISRLPRSLRAAVGADQSGRIVGLLCADHREDHDPLAATVGAVGLLHRGCRWLALLLRLVAVRLFRWRNHRAPCAWGTLGETPT